MWVGSIEVGWAVSAGQAFATAISSCSCSRLISPQAYLSVTVVLPVEIKMCVAPTAFDGIVGRMLASINLLFSNVQLSGCSDTACHAAQCPSLASWELIINDWTESLKQ
jgi:hypothetical protein